MKTAPVVVLVAALGATAAAEPLEPLRAPMVQPACDDPEIATRLADLLRARRFADAHHAAVALRVACGARDTWRVFDDVALLRLEDRPWALRDLGDLAHGPAAGAANAVLAWAYVTDRDREAAAVVIARLPAPRQAAFEALAALDDADAFQARARALPPQLSAQALDLGGHYRDARAKSPALAGVLSAIVPGGGQLYAGSLQAAAVSLVLNGLFIGATIELARDREYITATAAGTVASFFYVGGIINAVDLARRRNTVAQQPYADRLDELLVPELTGQLP